MNKLELQNPSLLYQPEIQSDPPAFQLAQETAPANTTPDSAGRLLALIPPDADYAVMMKKVWELATRTGTPIQLVSLCKDPSQEPSIRRELVTMSALIRDGRVCVEAKVEIGTNWVEVVRHNLQTGDWIVCFAEQQVGLFHKPLSQILRSNLKTPVYMLSGLMPQNSSRSNWLFQALMWVGSIGIIASSGLLQIRITTLSQDWAQATLLILSVIAEIGLILGWNSLFS
jgi:hypothetical protein